MIEYPHCGPLKDLHERQGLNTSQIAKEVALDRRTVAYGLTHDHLRPRKPRPHARKREPLKPDIVRWLERHPSSAAQGFPRLREAGVAGSYGRGKAYGHTVRPQRPPAFLTLALAPGACAQGDGGSLGAVPVGHTHRQLRFLVLVLCYRRMRSVACTVSQTMEPFLAGHQHACDFFGGIPQHVMVDNLHSAVLKRAVGEAPVLHPPYRDLATHHGFPLAPWNGGKGNEKGRVENGGGYGKKHCLTGLASPDCRGLQPAARHGLDTVAHGRGHGETREQPSVFWHTERPALRPGPRHPFAIATVSQVRASRPCRGTVETNRSCVPAQYAGHA